MKKLIAMGAALAITATTVPAYADNSEEVIIGILGGVIGGLVVGGAIANGDDGYPPPRYHHPVRRGYYYEEGGYISHCRWIKRREFNPYLNGYEVVRVKICEE